MPSPCSSIDFITSELQALETFATDEAALRFRLALRWRHISFALTLCAAALAALAAGSSLAEITGNIVAGLLALASAVFAAALGVIDAGANAHRNHTQGCDLLSLLDDVRAFRATKLHALPEDRAQQELRRLNARRDELLRRSGRVSPKTLEVFWGRHAIDGDTG